MAMAGERVVGVLTVVHHFPETSEITWMAVHAGRRGRGVGRALISSRPGSCPTCGPATRPCCW